jgi:hypothetical protein
MSDHDDMLSASSDRFERRLAEESGQLRSEIAQLRVDMIKQGSGIRLEVGQLRLDMTEQFAASKIDAEARHRDLLKWALVSWVGQAASTAAIVSAFK